MHYTKPTCRTRTTPLSAHRCNFQFADGRRCRMLRRPTTGELCLFRDQYDYRAFKQAVAMKYGTPKLKRRRHTPAPRHNPGTPISALAPSATLSPIPLNADVPDHIRAQYPPPANPDVPEAQANANSANHDHHQPIPPPRR